MAIVVNAGQTVVATVSVQNAGGQKGTFRLQGQILTYLENLEVVGNFWLSPGYSSTNPPPPGANIAQFELNPGETKQITMYSGVWADGNPQAFPSGQYFHVYWTLTCVETGYAVQRKDNAVLQHQSWQPVKTPPPPVTNLTGNYRCVAPNIVEYTLQWDAVERAYEYQIRHVDRILDIVPGIAPPGRLTYTGYEISNEWCIGEGAYYTVSVHACNTYGCSPGVSYRIPPAGNLKCGTC